MAIAVLLVSTGCRSGKRSIETARTAYSIGDLESAATTLAELSQKKSKLQVPCELDLAVVEFASGDHEAAETRLRDLRDRLDQAPDSVAPGDAIALATDDTARPFQLADYEQVLLRSLLAACSLAGDGIDAEAYCLQANRLQIDAEQAAAEDESQSGGGAKVALAPYLRGVLREATYQDYDDAQRAFRLVSAIRPEFLPAQRDLERVAGGVHSPSGHGVLYVFALVGHGPRLVETVAPTTTASLQIASVLLRSVHKHQEGDSDQPVLPNVASVKVPDVEIPPSRLASIGVSLGGATLGVTETLTDIGRLAIEKTESEMPQTIARAVVRRVIKETSVTTASNSLGLQGDAAAALEFAAISAWSASEKADTRCWSLLPREIQVLRLELPVGTHPIDLLPIDAGGTLYGAATRKDVVIEDGRNSYCFVVAPEQIISVVD